MPYIADQVNPQDARSAKSQALHDFVGEAKDAMPDGGYAKDAAATPASLTQQEIWQIRQALAQTQNQNQTYPPVAMGSMAGPGYAPLSQADQNRQLFYALNELQGIRSQLDNCGLPAIAAIVDEAVEAGMRVWFEHRKGR